jgi:hypothetical protein
MVNLSLKNREEAHVLAFFNALLTTGLDKEEAKRKTAARFGITWADVEKII